jgi:hypothetical protein
MLRVKFPEQERAQIEKNHFLLQIKTLFQTSKCLCEIHNVNSNFAFEIKVFSLQKFDRYGLGA